MATQTKHEETAASGGRKREADAVVGAGIKCIQPILGGCFVSDTGPGPVRDVALVDFKLSENLCVLKPY